MGTDMEIWVEIRLDGKWTFVGQYDLGRSYDSYGILANVRNSAEVPSMKSISGIPENPSKEVQEEFWDGYDQYVKWLPYKAIKEYNFKQDYQDQRISTIKKSTGQIVARSNYSDSDNMADDYELQTNLIMKPEQIISENYWKFIQKLHKLAKKHGEENIRIIMFFS